MRLFLLGFMGSGKTTIGQQLSKELNYDFIDTDKLFVSQYGISIPDFFEKYGEQEFRSKEAKVLKSIENPTNTVISTGGGLPCYNENINYINDTGKSLYVYMKVNALCERLIENEQSKRPLLKELDTPTKMKAFIADLLTKRERYYFNSHLVVDGGQSVADVVSDVVSHFTDVS